MNLLSAARTAQYQRAGSQQERVKFNKE